ncbi:structural maintenance of chromosomes protein 1B [Oncorhynchus kisutch]|uniref:structural maintenance of chromosomes protein 1B n=1 Tax=Oncorhynchus kisutch TaxID=8019 RepID=UPI0009A0098E|nr:structural maintenance of chromosomes protein 1B [Oncorhynchus kisutch]
MGFLKQLDVDNFKSWRGKQVIGPFKRFNCIIGTNGSGKSNVMDALSFVMGERAATLRVKHTRDLIHGAHIGKPVSTTASVTMRYCDDNGEELNFCRSISGDSSEYRINGRQITLAKYTEELEKIGIVTKARNCLVFQGAVESIAMKNPKERTKMFERISQSLELSDDYDRKKEALQKAKEDTQFHFNKKRTATAEKKQVSSEKVEAQKYQELVDDLNQGRLQLNLFQLYHNEQGLSALSKTLRKRQEAVAGQKTGLNGWEQSIKAQKKEHGRFTRELQQIEKEIRGQEQTLSLRRSQYIKAKVNTSHHLKKVDDTHGALEKSQRMGAKKEEELAEFHQELQELERAWRDYERHAQEELTDRKADIQLEEEQLERYKELKELARKQGALLSQQTKKMHWEVKADHQKIEFDQRRKKEVEVSIKHSHTQLGDFTRRADKLEEYTNTCKSSLEESRQQEEVLSAELQRGRVRGEEVNQELGEVLGELQNARLDSQESKRQQQRNEVLENLRRLYPDTLFGRLVDLCSPIHKKYQLAVTKVFGRYMNAIVVSSEKVARDCIRFVKEERAEPETFLPIDYLDVSPLNERLRGVRGAKMMVDVVQCSPTAPQLKKVIQFVCGNALVCETLKEARAIAFDGPERLKTVALDGTMFSKSGVISGGSSHLRSKARRWDEKDMTKLKELKEQLTAELRGLVKLKRKEPELKQIQSQAQGVQTRLKYSHTELDTLRKKSIPNCHAEMSRLEAELANVESQLEMQKENMEIKELEMKKLQDRINQMEDVVFSDFCAEIGVANIREYEQEHLKQQQDVDRKRLEFESQRTCLKAQLEYEQGQLEQQRKKMKKLEETIAKEQCRVEEQKQEEEKLLVVMEESQSKVLDLKNHLQGKKTQASDSKAQVDQTMKSLQESSREQVKLQREVISAETALEQLRIWKHNLLLGCKIQGLPITLLSGSLDEISEVQLDSESLTESTCTTMDIYEREALMVIDYSGLGAELKDLAGEEVDPQVERLKETVSSLEGVLQRSTAPNLKALEKMRVVKDKFQGVVDAFDASTKAARRSNQEFEQVKAKRFRLFSQCFEHVSVVIDQIYKQLCRNTSAQAILSAENPDEPYLDGINYNCIAPGKRFMAMDNLSGGEKAIAALALVFAIHSFRPAPFFVLDEVDAALDNTNIGKVTSFIREQSRESLQIIVISLKEEFYSRADALLGVYPEFNECMFSRMLTLDLSPYPLNEENGTEREKEM